MLNYQWLIKKIIAEFALFTWSCLHWFFTCPQFLILSGWGWSLLWFCPSSLWHPLNEFSSVLCVWTQNNPFLVEKYKLGGPPPLVVGEPLRPEALIFNAWVPSSPIYCWLTVEKAPTKWYCLSGPTDNEKVIFSNHRFIIFCKICSERSFKRLFF